jgi:hypothetical protein
MGGAAVVATGDPAVYRSHRLGSPASEIVARLGSAPGDLQTLHTRPALLQELAWRPPHRSIHDGGESESVAGIVFAFIDDQLFRMTIDYDRAHTQELTPDDMLTSLTAAYGPRAIGRGVPPRGSVSSLDSATILATWIHADTSVTLQQSMYGGGFRLIVASRPLEARAAKAQADAGRGTFKP